MAVCSIMLILLCRNLWGWEWTKKYMNITLFIQMLLIVLTSRRTAILTVFLIVLYFMLWQKHRKWFSAAFFFSCLAFFLYLCCDPYLEFLLSERNPLVKFFTRGQPTEQVAGFNGRFELWGLYWYSFLESPWIGHGYTISTSTGYVYIWGKMRHLDAHNLLLQVMVSLGSIGFALFLWAVWLPISKSFKALRLDPESRKIGIFVLAVFLLFFFYGTTSSIFVTRVEPGVFMFFASVGLFAGRL
jgi:O-antigen ligase